jgi:hypothetical protein
MKVGDLVTFAPQSWGTPLEDRPIGIVMSVLTGHGYTPMATVKFAGTEIPYSSRLEEFEVVNEDW